MLISRHKPAATAPGIRAAIRARTEPVWMVAARHGVFEQTVGKWRKLGDVHDRSHAPRRLQTTLSPAQGFEREALDPVDRVARTVAVALRTTLLLPLDDLLASVRKVLNPNVSRSGFDRCLRRHGVGSLRALTLVGSRPAHNPCKAYEPGHLHLDVIYLPQMVDEDCRYRFVAIDRATRWVFVRSYPAKTAANARRLLRDPEGAAPMRFTRGLTDHGKEVTDRLFGLRKRAATRNHDFDRLCDGYGIEPRPARPMRPHTSARVEPFNGRIEDVGQCHRFRSGEDPEHTVPRYVRLYNGQVPQSVFKGRTPIALKDWHRHTPKPFKNRPYNRTVYDSSRRAGDRVFRNSRTENFGSPC